MVCSKTFSCRLCVGYPKKRCTLFFLAKHRSWSNWTHKCIQCNNRSMCQISSRSVDVWENSGRKPVFDSRQRTAMPTGHGCQ